MAPESVHAFAWAWLEFFRHQRISDGCGEEGAEDMLLFECGHRQELPGHYGACYYVNLTRQFISETGEDDDAMFQLVWTAEYEPTAALNALKHESEWCDTPTAFEYFSKRVLSSDPLCAVRGMSPKNIQHFLTPI